MTVRFLSLISQKGILRYLEFFPNYFISDPLTSKSHPIPFFFVCLFLYGFQNFSPNLSRSSIYNYLSYTKYLNITSGKYQLHFLIYHCQTFGVILDFSFSIYIKLTLFNFISKMFTNHSILIFSDSLRPLLSYLDYQNGRLSSLSVSCFFLITSLTCFYNTSTKEKRII